MIKKMMDFANRVEELRTQGMSEEEIYNVINVQNKLSDNPIVYRFKATIVNKEEMNIKPSGFAIPKEIPMRSVDVEIKTRK